MTSFYSANPVEHIYPRIDGTTIYNSGENSPYYARLTLFDANDNVLDLYDYYVEDPAYTYDNFEMPAGQILAGITDATFDLDNNGLYDILRLNVPVQVAASGFYRLNGSLLDNENNENNFEIAFEEFLGDLNPGTTNIDLDFDGREINKSGENSPYAVVLSLLDGNSNMLNSRQYFIETPVNYDNFEVMPAQLIPTITDEALDNDSDGYSDYLKVTVPLQVSVAGQYTVEAEILTDNFEAWATRSNLGWASFSGNLTENDNSVTLYFDGRKLYSLTDNRTYVVETRLKDENNSTLDDNWYYTQFYNYDNFEVPPVMISKDFHHTYENQDIDNDGLYDYLIVHANFNVVTAGSYQINANLLSGPMPPPIANAYAIGVFTSPGTQSIDLIFTGSQINQSGKNGPYTLELHVNDPMTQWSDDNNNAGQISGYSFYNFESAQIRFAQTYSEELLDSDSDGKYDYLVVNVDLESLQGGDYILEGNLHDNNMNWITRAENKQTFGVENKAVALSFSGSDIRNSQDNAPYRINISLKTSNWQMISENLYLTENQSYTYDIFTQPAAEFKAGEHTDENENVGGDDFYDALIVNAKLSIKTPGKYFINADLMNGGGIKFISHAWVENMYESVGDYNVRLKFSGSDIFKSLENAPYVVRLWLWGDLGGGSFVQGNGEHNVTASYTYLNFERPNATIQNSGHNDYAEDLGSDNDNDYLVVEVNLSVSSDGTYLLGGGLNDDDWRFLGWSENRVTLSAGTNIVALRFDGYQIRATGSAPTRAHFNLMDENWKQLGWADYVLQTVYDPSTFSQPPIAFADNNSYHGDDTDVNGYFDFLTVDVELNVSTAGRYQIFADLFKEDSGQPWMRQWLGWAELKSTLGTGSQTVSLSFNGSQIYTMQENGPYTVEVHLQGEGWQWYGDNRISNINLNYDNFQRPSIEFAPPHTSYALDNDNNGLYDYIIENVKVNVNTAGSYKIGGVIGKTDTSQPGPPKALSFTMTEVNLNAGGDQTIQLVFDTARIYTSAENGPYFIGMALLDENFEPLLMSMDTTAAYTFNQFEQPVAQFYSTTTDYGIDENTDDADNDYDYLGIKVNLQMTEAGTYTVAAQIWYENLSGGKRLPIDWRENIVTFGAGDNEVELRFDGYGIVKSQVEGKLYAEIVLFDENEKILDMTTPPYETNSYSYEQFKPTKSANYNLVSGLPIASVSSGQSTSVDIEDNDITTLSKVDLTAGENLSGATLGVTEHEQPPPGSSAPSGTSLGYMDISVNGSENIRSGTIHFKIAKSTISDNNLDNENIKLLHFNENTKLWETLDTVLENEDENYLYYAAQTSSFSWFGISAGTAAAVQQSQQSSTSVSPSVSFVPAIFNLGALSVPSTITIGDTATITISINNSGQLAGSYTANLKLDGVLVGTQSVSLTAGASGQASFSITPSAIGTYTLEFANQVATLTVLPDVVVSAELVRTISTISMPSIATTSPAIFEFAGTDITQIAISVLQGVENVKLKVQQLSGKPTELSTPEGTVYSYLEILAEKLSNSNINSATITFKIEKSWFVNENVDVNNIVLMRYRSGQWENLTTEKSSEDENYYYYTATTPGFSVFAVSGTPAGISTPGSGTGGLPTLPTQPFAQVPYLPVAIIAAVLLLVVIIAVIWRYLSLGAKSIKSAKEIKKL